MPAATPSDSTCQPTRSKPSTPPEQETASSQASSQGFWSRRACGSAVRKEQRVRRSVWGMRGQCEHPAYYKALINMDFDGLKTAMIERFSGTSVKGDILTP